MQREIEVQIRSLFLNAPVKSFVVARMTAVRLPGTFEEAVAPGQAWKYEVDLDVEVFTQVRWTKRERKQQFKVKNDCTNSERMAASTLHSKFTGGMVSITCKTTGRGDDAVHTFAYLEDYGIFFGTARKTAKIESELVVQNWE